MILKTKLDREEKRGVIFGFWSDRDEVINNLINNELNLYVFIFGGEKIYSDSTVVNLILRVRYVTEQTLHVKYVRLGLRHKSKVWAKRQDMKDHSRMLY